MPNKIKDIPQNIIDSIVDIATGSTFRKGFIFYFLIINLDFFLILFGKNDILNNLRKDFPWIYKDIPIQYFWSFLWQFIIKPSLFGFGMPILFDFIDIVKRFFIHHISKWTIKKMKYTLANHLKERDEYIKKINELEDENKELKIENQSYKRSVQENEQSKPDKARPKRINLKVLL